MPFQLGGCSLQMLWCFFMAQEGWQDAALIFCLGLNPGWGRRVWTLYLYRLAVHTHLSSSLHGKIPIACEGTFLHDVVHDSRERER